MNPKIKQLSAGASFFWLLIFSTTLFRSAVAEVENPIVFVGQVPVTNDYGTVAAPFSNHLATMKAAPRGGGLYIYYPDDKSLKNLTKEFGYLGETGAQTGALAVAVRDPSVHPDGTKVVFSMIVGAPTQFEESTYQWQLYEVTGLGKSDAPDIVKVAGQPAGVNNVMPVYGNDGDIFFVSDRPRDGASHLYPQLGEKESAPANTGLYKILTGGRFELVSYASSGIFNPAFDSRGKLIFSKANFLAQDPQGVGDTYGAFNFSAEESTAVPAVKDKKETFPEQQPSANTVPYELGNDFFYLLPWESNPDGSQVSTLFGLGRHELLNYFEASRTDDPDINTFLIQFSTRNSLNSVNGLVQLRESQKTPGSYYATNAVPYVHKTNAAGQLVWLTPDTGSGPQGLALDFLTHPDTADVNATPTASHVGFFRDALELSDGSFIAAHTAHTIANENLGTVETPDPLHDFRIRELTTSGDFLVPAGFLSGPGGIAADLTYFNPDTEITYVGPLWELQPVELKARKAAADASGSLSETESSLFAKESVSEADFKEYLRSNKLALIIVRDATSRDSSDKQQPYNLSVAGSNRATIADPEGISYHAAALQVFQADQVRGYDSLELEESDEDDEAFLAGGRRVLPLPLHDADNPLASNLAAGAVALQSDGSAAALVPADRPISFQLIDESGQALVRERFWFSLKAGEISACGSCHPANNLNQLGAPDPDHEAIALRSILRWWKGSPLSVTPVFDFSVRGTRKKTNITTKSLKRRKIFMRRYFQIDLRPLGGDYNFQDLEIALQLGKKKRCTAPLAKFQTDEGGYALLSGRGPRLPRRKLLMKLQLMKDGQVLNTEKVKLIRRNFPPSRNKKIKGRRFKKLCRQMGLS